MRPYHYDQDRTISLSVAFIQYVRASNVVSTLYDKRYLCIRILHLSILAYPLSITLQWLSRLITMVSMKRIDAAADAIVSLVDGTARPLLVSLHENLLVRMRHVDVAADIIVSLIDGTARPLLVSLHNTLVQVLQSFMHSIQFATYCIGIITAMITLYGVIQILAAKRHIYDSIRVERISVIQKELSQTACIGSMRDIIGETPLHEPTYNEIHF